MTAIVYPSQLYKLIIEKNTSSLEASEVREERLQDSIENNNDPNDMPLEVKKNLEANLGPIDTEGEIDAHGLDKEIKDEYESYRP